MDIELLLIPSFHKYLGLERDTSQLQLQYNLNLSFTLYCHYYLFMIGYTILILITKFYTGSYRAL